MRWADGTIWDIVRDLSEEEFTQSFGKHGGSIHRRYVHLAQDLWEWHHDWRDENPDQPPFDQMTRNELFESISDYTNRIEQLIDNTQYATFAFNARNKRIEMIIDEFIFHIANHATYHRGQIVMCLRMLGKDTPMTDYVPFRIRTD
jgi:uncharacterized damage-inducible protein DinB